MATKKCPNCDNDCPVASSSCKKCLHVFKSRKGSSNSFSSSSSSSQPASNQTEDTGGGGGNGGGSAATESPGRRHTGRITRSKPNFYDSLHVEEQMRQDIKLKSQSGMKQEKTCNEPVRRVFVTVGTTSFEGLVNAVQSKDVLESFRNIGVEEVRVQMGDSGTAEGKRTYQDLQLEFFRYKNDIKADIERADLIVSHAGAGTVLDVLGQQKRLIVVPNDALMDNHQDELATYLSVKKYAYSSTVATLSDTLNSVLMEDSRSPLPPANSQTIDQFLTAQMNLSCEDSRSSVGRVSLGRLALVFIVVLASFVVIIQDLTKKST